ncbi:MAG: hypothetical protein C0423_16515 [Methylibium sp.]|nr:hypothetical protein [Methylibium sp.]
MFCERWKLPAYLPVLDLVLNWPPVEARATGRASNAIRDTPIERANQPNSIDSSTVLEPV